MQGRQTTIKLFVEKDGIDESIAILCKRNFAKFRRILNNCVFGRSKYLTTYEFRGKTQSQQKAAPPVPVEVCEHTRECRLINYELLDLDFNFFLIFVSFFRFRGSANYAQTTRRRWCSPVYDLTPNRLLSHEHCKNQLTGWKSSIFIQFLN